MNSFNNALILVNLYYMLLYCTVRCTSMSDHKAWEMLPSGDCGIGRKPVRITNGKEADLGQFPWIARLGYEDGQAIKFKCGGTLLNKWYVITAAHCLKENEEKLKVIRLGENVENEELCDKAACSLPVQDIPVASIMIHAEYNTITSKNDIGLIALRKSANYTDFVKPVCLPRGDLTNENHLGEEVTVAGWGVIDSSTEETSPELLFVNIPVVELDVCRKIYKSIELDDTQWCVGKNTGEDSCSGDSGGPLMNWKAKGGSKQYFLLGIVSFGQSYCGENPSVYTNTNHFMLWILDNILAHRKRVEKMKSRSPKNEVRNMLKVSVDKQHSGINDIESHPNWIHLDTDQCGYTRYISKQRIVNGEKASLGQFPWIARLGRQRIHYIYFDCGGTLINPYYVITAAHCGTDHDVVRLGENYITDEPDCDETGCAPLVQDIPIEKNKLFGYNTTNYKNDLMLSRLKFAATLNEFVWPACLPFGPVLEKDYVGSHVQIAGWGYTDSVQLLTSDNLMYINAPVLDTEACNKIFKRPLNPATQYCVGFPKEEKKDSCAGDSGGPMTKSENIDGERRHFLLGLVSYGVRRCGDGPAVYTRIIAFLPELLDEIVVG
ncbi:unnamed protein product [Acanthoscelides obtectus]|uniref:Peptidase S1 domain-containing protein n=1 Tax=Acanthoscelides obtectus TaxID=200917 RepID=A0A9P0L3H6_ACAOB|nr:unnamed protein product [Acanthoscelides obtectus]CAK1643997.1 hypothetical protein AOBTE_LOCUS13770 [Acanthoscelides obtectus]